MHGSNRLGGNSLSDLLVFGRRAGLGAAEYVDRTSTPVRRSPPRCRRRGDRGAAPFHIEGGENPYTMHSDLQQTMNDLVGIIRTESEIRSRR
jgi:succinate dehydrogenase / fumarate reductase flavoprotein subunit